MSDTINRTDTTSTTDITTTTDPTATIDDSSLFDLESIRDGEYSEEEWTVLKIFAHGIQPAMPGVAAEAAHQFDILCPPLEQVHEANHYLYTLWNVMITIARSPDVTSDIHVQLVGILQILRQTSKGELDVYGAKRRVWRDSPQLSYAMDAFFSDPMQNVATSVELTPREALIWRNLNSFAARCLGADVAGPYSDAMYAMRSALEEDLSTIETNMIRCKVQVACDWILHAAKPFLWWARENIDYYVTPDDQEGQYIEGGALYHGPPAMCLQRWAFWQGRFEEIGKEDSILDEETKNITLETARLMKTIESSMAPTFLQYRPDNRSWQSRNPQPVVQKMYQDI
ncbi:hypothetical protein GLAREA_04714 [Glarea lozoyensis ATCC 20868]|uniref:Uncharacterized protein n=1 Tax=Glarea lozoyensis (strain ATCC 20868 / MF5171) TaxID=1116229 RepID=S3DN61_GLAL2|nr:uncharacterized protein GLAREA_04714 [Glarea lozoyensis ATCC 20868]EPE27923.1 hypothetical protein GLAREA_04714 [Glarea lozoyensis ATCC 20868]